MDRSVQWTSKGGIALSYESCPSLERVATLALVFAIFLAMFLGAGRASPYDDWHIWSDPSAGFELLIPPTHDVGATDRAWYVHGFIDGDPLVPDVAIYYQPDVTVEEALAEVTKDALAEQVTLGVETSAYRVTARHEGLHGPYVDSWYLVPASTGIYVIRGWEDLYWDWFHHVAITFRLLDR